MALKGGRGTSLLPVLVALVIFSAEVRAAPASQVIEQFSAALLKVMQEAETLGYAGRYDALAPAVTSSFALPFMAQVAAGRYWKNLSEAQQGRLVDAFTQMTIATYAARFNDYSGQLFEIVGEEPARRDTTLVKTRLVKGDGEAIAINYLLRRKDETWEIVDIYLKGRISELALRRAEYVSVLRREGFDGLLSVLQQKLAGLEEKP